MPNSLIVAFIIFNFLASLRDAFLTGRDLFPVVLCYLASFWLLLSQLWLSSLDESAELERPCARLKSSLVRLNHWAATSCLLYIIAKVACGTLTQHQTSLVLKFLLFERLIFFDILVLDLLFLGSTVRFFLWLCRFVLCTYAVCSSRIRTILRVGFFRRFGVTVVLTLGFFLSLAPLSVQALEITCRPVVTAQRFSYRNLKNGCETLFEYTCYNESHVYWDVSYVDAVDSFVTVTTPSETFVFNVLPPLQLCSSPCCSLCYQHSRPLDCCTRDHGSPTTCDGGAWAHSLRTSHPSLLAYFYAYDDSMGLHLDLVPLSVTFFPLGSDKSIDTGLSPSPLPAAVSCAHSKFLSASSLWPLKKK